MDPNAGIDVAILGAVSGEISTLSELLESLQVFPFRGQTIWLGKVANLSVLLGTTGLGKVNAAITTASLLEHFSIAQVWNVGCAGAFPEGPLRVGDVLVTERCYCGDEGVLTQNGVLPVSAIGIPLLIDNGEALFDHLPRRWNSCFEMAIKKTPPGAYRQKQGFPPSRAFPLMSEDRSRARRSGAQNHPASEAHPAADFSAKPRHNDEDAFTVIHGPSLTVSLASGDPAVASDRFRRYGAYAENMEGSAVVQACLRFRIPAVECRGMSNVAGVRAKETWQLEKSIAHCHGIVINWLETLNSLKLLN